MYFEQTKLKTWDEAYSGCLEIGMELAILNSQDDYDAAKDLITSRLVYVIKKRLTILKGYLTRTDNILHDNILMFYRYSWLSMFCDVITGYYQSVAY